MAQRDGAAVDVELVLREAEGALDRDRRGGVRLVVLDAIEVGRLESGLLEMPAHGRDRRLHDVARVDAALADGMNPREGRRVAPPDLLLAREDERGSPVGQLRGAARGQYPVGGERGLEPRELLEGRVRARGFVVVEPGSARSELGRDGGELLGERAVGDRGGRSEVASQAERVDRRAVQPELPGYPLAGEPHDLVLVVRVDQRVALHRVVQHVRPGVAAPAHRPLHEVGGVRHALHAADEDAVVLAGADRREAEEEGLHARAADHVDGRGPDRIGDRDAAEDLARRVLTDPGLDRLAEQDLFDLVGADPAPLDGGAGGHDAEHGRADGAERAAEATDRCPGRGEDRYR